MNEHSYDDIIDLPRPVSGLHPPMPLYERAAQFAPFKALDGYEEDAEETARLTERRIEPAEGGIEALNAKLRLLEGRLADAPEVRVTYFRPDERKEGGAYCSVTGVVRGLDAVGGALLLRDGARIPFADILRLDGAVFGEADGL
ncbi:MAG: hypothetical protein K6G54_07820 [Oscillospiraceae bacterium]|nr:hypothetical protein [Oscillospiraceae bacterium]